MMAILGGLSPKHRAIYWQLAIPTPTPKALTRFLDVAHDKLMQARTDAEKGTVCAWAIDLCRHHGTLAPDWLHEAVMRRLAPSTDHVLRAADDTINAFRRMLVLAAVLGSFDAVPTDKDYREAGHRLNLDGDPITWEAVKKLYHRRGRKMLQTLNQSGESLLAALRQ